MSFTIDRDGFNLAPAVFSPEETRHLISELGPVTGAGSRGLLSLPAVASLARFARLLDIIRPHLATEPVAVRALYFDKSPDSNWLVPWHQDLTLALRAKVETPGYLNWSIKDGVPHVQPPVKCLEQMLTVRLHLDDTDETNGALRVLPGSHRLGRLSASQIQELHQSQPGHLCSARTGDVLLMRPLLLHASSRSTAPKHRRILHLEYAAFELPASLEWHDAKDLA